MSCDPNTLLAAARDFQRVSRRGLLAISTYLRCQRVLKVTTNPPAANQGRLVILDTTLGDTHIDLSSTPGITTVAFPNLVSVQGDLSIAGHLSQITFLPDSPTSIYLPLLKTVSGTLQITGTAITSLDLSSLQSAANVDLTTNTSLTSLSIQNLATLPGNGAFHTDNSPLAHLDLPSLTTPISSFEVGPDCQSIRIPQTGPLQGSDWRFGPFVGGDKLDAASVNHILARCVANAGFTAGVLELDGGTSAAPTGQGILDKATLIGRGVTVTTN